MDLSELAYTDSGILDLKDNNGIVMEEGGKVAQIEVFGPDTDEVMNAQTRYREERIKAGDDMKARRRAECRLLAGFTKRFHNVQFHDKDATAKDAFAIYMEVSRVRKQVDDYVIDDGNFIRSGPKS